MWLTASVFFSGLSPGSTFTGYITLHVLFNLFGLSPLFHKMRQKCLLHWISRELNENVCEVVFRVPKQQKLT